MPGAIFYVGQIDGLNSPATSYVEPFATYGSYGLVAHRDNPYHIESLSFANPATPSLVGFATGLADGTRKLLTDVKRGRIYGMANANYVVDEPAGGSQIDVYSATGLASGVTHLGTAISRVNNEFACSAALCNDGMTLVHSVDRSSADEEGYIVWDVSGDTPVKKYESPLDAKYGSFGHISYPMMGLYDERYVYYCCYAFGGSPLIPLDLSNPAAPVEGLYQRIPYAPYVGSASGVRAAIVNKTNPNYLYADYEGSVLHVYDISDRMNPAPLRVIAKTDGTPYPAADTHNWPTSEQYQQDGNYIVGGAGGGVHLIDVSNPGFPKIYASYDTGPHNFRGGGGGMAQVALLPNNHFAMSGVNTVTNTPAVAVFRHDFVNPAPGWAVGCG